MLEKKAPRPDGQIQGEAQGGTGGGENQTFLQAVFGDRWQDVWVTSVNNREFDPAAQGSWYGGRAAQKLKTCIPTRDNYFSIGMLLPGAPSRTPANLEYIGCLFLDDLGTKSDQEMAVAVLGPAHYELETSPGNWSWVYLVECAGKPWVDKAFLPAFEEVMEKLAQMGLTDPGARDAVRYCRLPDGTNNKPKYGADGWRVQLRGDGLSKGAARLRFEDLYRQLTGRSDLGASPGATGLGGTYRVRLDEQGNPLPPKFSGRLDTPDPWLRALNELGLVKGAGNKPGVVDITCPFVHEHTGRDDGSAYLGDGMFKCHHGHCVDREHRSFQAEVARKLEVNIGKRMAQVVFDAPPEGLGLGEDGGPTPDELSKQARDARARSQDESRGWDQVLGSYVYVAEVDRFAELTGGSRAKRLMTDREFAVRVRDLVEVGDSGKRSAANQFLNRGGRVVDTVDYLPGSGMVVRRDDGQEVFNTWRPSGVKPVIGVSDQDVKPWLDVVKWAYPDAQAQEVVLDFMAWLVQRPGEKINWAIITKSDQGIGKDSCWTPLQRILGDRNVSNVDMTMLESGFNGSWVECQLLVIQEVSSSHRVDIYNKLKPYVARPPETLEVNQKFQKPYRIDNGMCVIGFTNKDRALALEASDRRFWVYESPAAALPLGLATAFWDQWLKAPGTLALEKIYGWLMDRTVGVKSGFSPAKCPKAVGSAKDDMIEQARSPVESWVRDLLDDYRDRGRRVVTVAEIMDAGRNAPAVVKKTLTTISVGVAAKAWGARRWQGGQQVRTAQGRTRVWAVDKACAGDLLDADEVRKEADGLTDELDPFG